MLTFALIEDEPPARLRLKRLVQELRPGSVCLAEAGDGEAGLHLLRLTKPDLLFLDIEFPPEGAFGLLRRAVAEGLSLPAIVFVTAFDRYAVEAFRWQACDYLLKPVERSLLEESLQRLENRSAAPTLDLDPLMQALERLRKEELPQRFTVLHKGRLRVLAWEEVSHLSTENRLLLVHTAEGHYVLDRTLDELERSLEGRFLRCHRGAMVRLDLVRELIPEGGGSGELILKDGTRIPVSRDRMAEVRRRLA